MTTSDSRSARQALCLERWKALNGHGCITAATGFGKSRIAMNAIAMLQRKKQDVSVIIVTPSTSLQEQWVEGLKERNLYTDSVKVFVINSAVKAERKCDLLVLDECHRYPADTFRAVFDVVSYKMIMCLTATLERLDGKHVLIERYAPVVDTVTASECQANGWTAPYHEYMVLVRPDDPDEYSKLTRAVTEKAEFFGFDFNLALSCVGPAGWKRRYQYAKEICRNPAVFDQTLRSVAAGAVGLMRAVQARKKWIYGNPAKLRIAEEIIASRRNSKIITFSASVKDAERIPGALVYTGKEGRKKNRITLDEFKRMKTGVISTAKLMDEGVDITDANVGIMLGVNSSKIRHVQTRGRVTRYSAGKTAEFFTLVMGGTVELEWWKRSYSGACDVIDEANLRKVLRHEPYNTCGPAGQFLHRF